MAAKNFGAVPKPGELTGADRALLDASAAAFGSVGQQLAGAHFRAGLAEAMRFVGEANKYLSDQAPWKLANTDRDRMGSVLYTALQAIDDAKTMLTPFLPGSSSRAHAALGGEG